MIIIAVFLDNIDQEQTSQFRENREPFCHTFLATFRLLKDWRLLTLIPLTMYSGFEQSFLSGEYTKVRWGAAFPVPALFWRPSRFCLVSTELRDLRSGNPLCGLRDDVLRRLQLAVLLPVREDFSVHRQSAALPSG